MIFQITKSPSWKFLIQLFSIMLPTLAALIAGILMTEDRNPNIRPLGIALLVLSIIGIGIFIWWRWNAAVKTNVSFSTQLMDEYHAESSRPFSAIHESLHHSNGTTTVLTRDGKDTEVLVKALYGNAQRIAMEFIVLDNKELYPKPSK